MISRPCARHWWTHVKVLRGFEPRSLDSESRVLTVTPRGRANVKTGMWVRALTYCDMACWSPSSPRRGRRSSSRSSLLSSSLPSSFPRWSSARRGGAVLWDSTADIAKFAFKTLCPSGLRGWTQVPLARAAWVQIPQVSICRWCSKVFSPGQEKRPGTQSSRPVHWARVPGLSPPPGTVRGRSPRPGQVFGQSQPGVVQPHRVPYQLLKTDAETCCVVFCVSCVLCIYVSMRLCVCVCLFVCVVCVSVCVVCVLFVCSVCVCVLCCVWSVRVSVGLCACLWLVSVLCVSYAFSVRLCGRMP